MSKSIDIDKVGECVRNILDSNRCPICDKFGSIFRRCVYGHIACGDCSGKEEECRTCFTAFNSPVPNNTWVLDKLQSKKVENAINLLNTFQDTFKIDVYRRQRISDQLKAERELFPDCIQAPVKYSNKRKTLNLSSSLHDKENSHHSYLPGEGISPLQTSKMEKSKYVQRWLEGNSEKSSSRKPFANINVNNQSFSDVNMCVLKNKPNYKPRTLKTNSLNKRKQSSKTSTNKNRSNTSRRIKTHQKKSSLDLFPKISKDFNIENLNTIKQYGNISKLKDDSGIAMDDECITIEDTLTEIIDKDELALQAVHEAERNHVSDDSRHDYEDAQQKIDKHRVPYEKKSLLYVSCPNCNIDAPNYTNKISITVEYGSKVESNVNMQSVSVQTDISGINETSDSVTNIVMYDNDQYKKSDDNKANEVHIESQDLFMDDINIVNHVQNDLLVKKDRQLCDLFSQNKENIQIIDDSDTDVEAEHLQVAVDVHRTCKLNDYDILSELAVNELKNRKRRADRGVTPGSTDSSEKENFDPNRLKRSKCTKKGKKKPNKV